MTRPIPTHVFHFTHVAHLPDLVRHGLQSDSRVQGTGLLVHEAGDRGIKSHRRTRSVPSGPGGVVSDYVPFYFAPRSPMMFAINRGRVAEYTASIYDLVYLVTSIESLQASGSPIVLSDRNAAKAVADFSDDPQVWDSLVDWPLMKARIWRNTEDDPERQERRMAECLVHGSVDWRLITDIAVSDTARGDTVTRQLEAAGDDTRVHVRRDWYF